MTVGKPNSNHPQIYCASGKNKTSPNNLAPIPENEEKIPLDLRKIQIGFDNISPTSVHTKLLPDFPKSPFNVTNERKEEPVRRTPLETFSQAISNITGQPLEKCYTSLTTESEDLLGGVAGLLGRSPKASTSGTAPSDVKKAPSTENAANSALSPSEDPDNSPDSPDSNYAEEGIFTFE